MRFLECVAGGMKRNGDHDAGKDNADKGDHYGEHFWAFFTGMEVAITKRGCGNEGMIQGIRFRPPFYPAEKVAQNNSYQRQRSQ